jgi:flagellar biosynthesis chaperone FliJ
MFKRLMILGIAGLVFVLGANYLLVYTLKQQVTRERERQDRTYWSTFNAIEQFGEHPDPGTEQKAKAALDEARHKGLSGNRARILQDYFQDLESCYQGDRDSCKKANTDMNEAIRVSTERK